MPLLMRPDCSNETEFWRAEEGENVVDTEQEREPTSDVPEADKRTLCYEDSVVETLIDEGAAGEAAEMELYRGNSAYPANGWRACKWYRPTIWPTRKSGAESEFGGRELA